MDFSLITMNQYSLINYNKCNTLTGNVNYSFRFTAKLSRRYRGFLYSPCPHICMPSSQSASSPRVLCAFVAIDEPTLTHHDYPESIVCIKVHSWCYIFYRFWKIFNECKYHHSIIQTSFIAGKICALAIDPSLLQSLIATDLFSAHRVSPFPECHIVGVIHVSFSDWLL